MRSKAEEIRRETRRDDLVARTTVKETSNEPPILHNASVLLYVLRATFSRDYYA
jgi:hypothetical protein